MELKKNGTITLGSWWRIPLKWRIAETDPSGEALLVCKKFVAVKQFGGKWDLWENSDLREWLNGTFFNGAFTEDEKKLIIPTETETCLYDEGQIVKKELTEDMVFILSREEYVRFVTPASRRCTCLVRDVDRAFAEYGKYLDNSYDADLNNLLDFGIECWLRGRWDDHGSPYYPAEYTSVVYDKRVDYYDDGDPANYYGVRPAVRIRVPE